MLLLCYIQKRCYVQRRYENRVWGQQQCRIWGRWYSKSWSVLFSDIPTSNVTTFNSLTYPSSTLLSFAIWASFLPLFKPWLFVMRINGWLPVIDDTNIMTTWLKGYQLSTIRLTWVRSCLLSMIWPIWVKGCQLSMIQPTWMKDCQLSTIWVQIWPVWLISQSML